MTTVAPKKRLTKAQAPSKVARPGKQAVAAAMTKARGTRKARGR